MRLHPGGTLIRELLTTTRLKGLQNYIEVVILPYSDKTVPMYLRYIR
jgi:hypothetical protein